MLLVKWLKVFCRNGLDYVRSFLRKPHVKRNDTRFTSLSLSLSLHHISQVPTRTFFLSLSPRASSSSNIRGKPRHLHKKKAFFVLMDTWKSLTAIRKLDRNCPRGTRFPLFPLSCKIKNYFLFLSRSSTCALSMTDIHFVDHRPVLSRLPT